MKEIWKDIPGYEGLYQASNLGNIRSLDKVVRHFRGGTAVKKGKVMTLQKKTKNGYTRYYVYLHNETNKQEIVSRLVWSAFNGPIPEGMQVNHIDENPMNNRIENLNLMSAKENCNWGTRNERCAEHNINHPGKSKKIIQLDLDGNFIREWESGKEIYRTMKYSNGTISGVCSGRRKTAYGYKWKYKDAV